MLIFVRQFWEVKIRSKLYGTIIIALPSVQHMVQIVYTKPKVLIIYKALMTLNETTNF